MKNLNKKVWVVIATALFLAPAISFANEMEMSNWSSSMTMTSESSTADIFLKGKIDGYKVTLAWNEFKSEEEVLWYKIVLTNSAWEEKTISVWSDKNSVENWDAKAGKNVYQLFVMGADWELAESNEVVLNMGPNGGYDFGSSQWQYQKPSYGEGYKNEQKPFYGSWLTQEQKTQLEYLKKSLEEQIKTLRESITPENLEEVKAKAEELKTTFLAKAEALGIPEVKKMIEERFKIFFENNFTKREEFKKLADQKKEEMKKIVQEKKEQFDAAKKQGQEQFQEKKEEFKQKMQDTKQNFKNLKQDLKAKYKDAFAKKLEGKLEKLWAEKLKAVITKIDSVIAKYQANENLTAEQKEKFVAQLNAIKELLQEKLDELENGINLDELLGE